MTHQQPTPGETAVAIEGSENSRRDRREAARCSLQPLYDAGWAGEAAGTTGTASRQLAQRTVQVVYVGGEFWVTFTELLDRPRLLFDSAAEVLEYVAEVERLLQGGEGE